MKINIGCHIWHLEGFINIDIDEKLIPKPDLIADGRKLPFEDNSIDEIYAGHMLEHYRLEDRPLEEWKRVLKPNGRITITVPDIEKGLVEYRKGDITLECLHTIVYGDGNTAGEHYKIYTKDLLEKEVGALFRKTEIIENSPYVVADVKYQTIITAIK